MKFSNALLPSFVALIAAGLVVTGTWILPATKDSEAAMTVVGGIHEFKWNGGRDRSRSFEWAYALDVPGNPSDWSVLPRVLYSFDVEGDLHPESHYGLDLRVFINDQQAHRQMNGAYSFGLESDHGEPFRIDDVDQSLLTKGRNEIRLVMDVYLDVAEPGNQTYHVKLGPVHAYTYATDSQGDGVLDIHQVVPFHAALLALPGAVLSAVGVFAATTKAVAWWRVRG